MRNLGSHLQLYCAFLFCNNTELFSFRFILSCGKDSNVKLWEVASGRLAKHYVGATHTQLRCQVCHQSKTLSILDRHTERLVHVDYNGGACLMVEQISSSKLKRGTVGSQIPCTVQIGADATMESLFGWRSIMLYELDEKLAVRIQLTGWKSWAQTMGIYSVFAPDFLLSFQCLENLRSLMNLLKAQSLICRLSSMTRKNL